MTLDVSLASDLSVFDEMKVYKLIPPSNDIVSFEGKYRIGLTGSHRTGKSSLAKMLAELIEVPYLDMAIGKNAVWNIFNSHDNVTFAERLVIQKRLLADVEQVLKDQKKNESFVSDRTPVDLLSYLLCNIDSTTSELFDEEVEEFIAKCRILTLKYFDMIFVVQPGILFEKNEGKNGKVYNSIAYQESLTNSCIGFLHRLIYSPTYRGRMLFRVIPSDLIFLDDRVQWMLMELNASSGSA